MAAEVNLNTLATEVAEKIMLNGPSQPTWAIYISAAAILAAALGGALWQRRISRQTLTFNTIMNQLWDGDYIEQRQLFIKLRDNGGDETLVKHGSKANEGTADAMAIRSILNNYELMALGIMTGVLDETLYKRYLKTTVLKDFERIKPYVDEVRKRAPKSYTEYEALYEKWRKP